MAYAFPIDPAELFVERTPQMLSTGIAPDDLDGVRTQIVDMWADAPGGWVFEWSRLARRYAENGQPSLSAVAYGWAKFPTLATPAMRTALENQLEQYLRAAPDFPVEFERRVLDLPHKGGRTPVPVHILSMTGLAADAPVLVVTGGVDTWKMDMHGLFVALALMGVARVLTFDIAGTGESQVAMSADGGAEIAEGVVAAARAMGARKVAYFGVSMGGHFAARLGLSGLVDAAVDFGGPVGAKPGGGRPTRFGMFDIVANALGYDHRPDPEELVAQMAGFSLRALLDQDRNGPMLVVNGADDVHVPREDTLAFEGRRATSVHLIPDTGHCATTKSAEAFGIIQTWLRDVLAD